MRRLIVTRRVVPLDRGDEYAAAWQRLADAVAEVGGRAWLFRRAGHDDHFCEFIEWVGAADVTEQEPVLRAARDVDAVAPAPPREDLEEAESL